MAAWTVTTEQRAQMQRDLLTLKAGLLAVTVSSDPPGATIVDVRTPVEGAPTGRNLVRFAHGADAPGRSGHGYWPCDRHGTPSAGYLDRRGVRCQRRAPRRPTCLRWSSRPSPTTRRSASARSPRRAYVSGGATIALAIGGRLLRGALAPQKHSDLHDCRRLGCMRRKAAHERLLSGWSDVERRDGRVLRGRHHRRGHHHVLRLDAKYGRARGPLGTGSSELPRTAQSPAFRHALTLHVGSHAGPGRTPFGPLSASRPPTCAWPAKASRRCVLGD